MATITGAAVVFGANGLVWTGTIASATTEAATQSAQMTRDGQVVDIEDENGDVASRAFFANRKQLSVTVIPYHDTTISGAHTSADAWNAQSGVTCSIADSRGTVYDDVYNVISTSSGRTNNGLQTIDLVLEAFDANEITTAIS